MTLAAVHTTYGTQSTARKKMAAGHFTTIPCEPNTATRHIESHINIFLCNSSLYNQHCVGMLGLKFLKLFCFYEHFSDLRALRIIVNVPVAIFFGRVD